MTIHFSAYIATSLDGFIARSNGDLDWLFNATTSTDDHGYAEYMNGIDTIVMGRNTYQTVLGFGEWPYPEKRVVVLSTTLSADAIPSHLQDKLLLHPGPLPQLLKSLTEHGCNNVYVDGGSVIQSFLAARLLDQITVTTIPILIGSGIPLFGNPGHDIRLAHHKTTAFDSGFVQTTYQISH
ncbi:dihydrofolate reductase family protein [Herbaspirillum autotrophicum]|uniref:dihydrofolate reductase family protein n=1 Tax=Herbaspirillum autotrophicum TaxID=180195 RepID=UPI00067DDD7C|nr:dihydrofolate reductase family protein [Herbaspirillum autotrophicum]